MYKERDDLNYTLIINKDGNYSWRPLVLLHPILYVDLVNCLTKEDHWEELKRGLVNLKKIKILTVILYLLKLPKVQKGQILVKQY